MKKNDIALTILIVAISLAISYFVLKLIIGTPEQNTQKVQVVEPISAGLTAPSSKVFNSNAINPTVVIQIGDPSNQAPFGN